MTDGSRHRVHHATVEIVDRANGSALFDRKWNEWCNGRLFESLDRACSEICPPDTHLFIPSLRIELQVDGLEGGAGDDADHHEQITRVLKEHLRAALDRGARSEPVARRISAVMIAYLRTGTIAERYSEKEWSEMRTVLTAEVLRDPGIRTVLLPLLAARAPFRRWLALTGEPFQYRFLRALAGWSTADTKSVIMEFAALINRFRASFTHDDASAVFQAMYERIGSGDSGLPAAVRHGLALILRAGRADDLRRIAMESRHPLVRGAAYELLRTGRSGTRATAGAALPGLSADTAPASGETDAAGAGETAIHIANAGMVLAAQFLPAFFRNVGCVTAEGECARRERMPMLLHVIATGKRRAQERDLALAKLFCGIPFDDACETAIVPSGKERKEINALLRSMIQHWSRLGNAGTQALRETFLQREGTLEAVGPLYRLTVRRDSVDVLLQFVPWAFHGVKLPWMPRALLVEW